MTSFSVLLWTLYNSVNMWRCVAQSWAVGSLFGRGGFEISQTFCVSRITPRLLVWGKLKARWSSEDKSRYAASGSELWKVHGVRAVTSPVEAPRLFIETRLLELSSLMVRVFCLISFPKVEFVVCILRRQADITMCFLVTLLQPSSNSHESLSVLLNRRPCHILKKLLPFKESKKLRIGRPCPTYFHRDPPSHASNPVERTMQHLPQQASVTWIISWLALRRKYFASTRVSRIILESHERHLMRVMRSTCELV